MFVALQLVHVDSAETVAAYKDRLTAAVSCMEVVAPRNAREGMQQGVVTLLLRNNRTTPARWAEVRVNTRRNMLELFTLVVSE